ncbi:MAG: MFS transporter [Anaerolineaceae bacterium]
MQNNILKTGKTSSQKWLVLLSVGIGSFMSAYVGSVINVSLPTITEFFNSNIATTEWIVTIYLLEISSLLLAFGRMGDLRGHKRVYSLGFILFTLGSVLCGFSNSPGMMIGFRVAQALGGAMLLSNSPAILTGNFPPEQRGQALGLQATLTYLGLTVGPSLGGWVTDQFGWPAVFFMNVPIGLIGLFFCLKYIPADHQTSNHERFDWRGAFIFMIGLVALLYALNRGQVWGWLSTKTLVLSGSAMLVLAGFVFLQLNTMNPLLDLKLFRIRAFSFTTIGALINYVSLYFIMFLMPFYLIQGREYSPTMAGLILTAQPIMMAVVAPVSGSLSDRISPRWLSTIGMVILAVGLWQLSRLDGSSSIVSIMLALGIAGFGTGMFISPNNNVLLGSAPRNRQGIASGILATARSVGMVLGVGIAGAIFTTVIARGAFASPEMNIFPAIRLSYVFCTGIALIGALTSYMSGHHEKTI